MPLVAASRGHAQQPTADLILTNGKIVTVDDRFTFAQAVAAKGERIIAVGKNQEIAKLAGAAARKIDLRGKTVATFPDRRRPASGRRPTLAAFWPPRSLLRHFQAALRSVKRSISLSFSARGLI